LSSRLVSAPNIEAAGLVEKLSLRDERTLRFSLFSLQKYIKEEQFASEFLNRDGLRELIDIINTMSGNTLAYALAGMQNLMELETGWGNLDKAFIYKVVQILANPNNLINVCRPATAILKKLVEADPRSIPGPMSGSGSRSAPPVPPPGSVYRFGFDVVWEQMKREQGLLDIVVNRLGSADSMMAVYRFVSPPLLPRELSCSH
jgi:engulfment/cell motility protein 1